MKVLSEENKINPKRTINYEEIIITLKQKKIKRKVKIILINILTKIKL
jgi:hypothetical protein